MSSRLFSSKYIFVYLFLLGLTALLSACGGGGGGGTKYPDLSYTGVQTQAVIDQDNADDFPFVVLQGGGDSQNIPLAVTVDGQADNGTPDPETIKKATGIITNIIKNKFASNANAVAGASFTENGTCGGKFKYTEDVGNTSFSGSMTFDKYCEYDGFTGYEFTIHGKMTFSGTYHLDAVNNPVFDTLSINIVYLKFTLDDGVTTVSEEFSGSITVNTFDPNNVPVDFTMSVNYEYNGKIFKMANFEVDEFAGTISATLYHPDHGYVVITTTDPFTYDPVNEEFCSGGLEITGSDGAGNSAVIEFTDYGCTTYDICVTINPDPRECSTGNNWGEAPSVWVVM